MDYERAQEHEMVLRGTDESGAEEWYCPICGRRFLMQWPPAYKKIILEPGDEQAIHSGGKGGLQPFAALSDEQVPVGEWMDDANLEPWTAWMEQVNFESLWNKDL